MGNVGEAFAEGVAGCLPIVYRTRSARCSGSTMALRHLCERDRTNRGSSATGGGGCKSQARIQRANFCLVFGYSADSLAAPATQFVPILALAVAEVPALLIESASESQEKKTGADERIRWLRVR